MYKKLATVVLLFIGVQCVAQDYPGLVKLQINQQPVYFTPGHEKRAKAIGALCDEATTWFSKELGFRANTRLLILGPEDWKKYGTFPVYGMAHYPDSSTLVIAAEDNELWRSFLPVIKDLAPDMAARVRKTYTDETGKLSMMPFFDLLALHELGHGFHEQAKLNMQRFWIQELVPNLMLHTFIAETHPEMLPALEIMPQLVVSAGSKDYEHTTLESFEKLYDTMDPRNYGWYQCNLHVAAADIYNAGGKSVMKRFWETLRKTKTIKNDPELAELLEKKVHRTVADVMLTW